MAAGWGGKPKKTRPLPGRKKPAAAAWEVILSPIDFPPAKSGSPGPDSLPAAAGFHVREVVAEGRSAALGEPESERLHEGVTHPRARTVHEGEEPPTLRRPNQDAGDLPRPLPDEDA